MNIENTENHVLQPDVCRCCLSTNGTWDMSTSYITEDGTNNFFSHILNQCFGITLSCVSEWDTHRMVCESCMVHLRDACSFRKQVLQAERQFLAYCSNETVSDGMVIKTEFKIDNNSLGCFEDLGNIEADDNETHKENVTTAKITKCNVNLQNSNTSKKKSGHKIILKAKRKRRKIVDDVDSDTPIAELSKKIELKAGVLKNGDYESTDLDGNAPSIDAYSLTAVKKGLQHTQNVIKQVSERKRVMLTCEAILRDTTACPFRHHKSWFQCFFCQQDFMEINLLRDHTLKTHNNIDDEIKKIKRYPRSLQIEISKLECRRCHLNLTDVNTMRRHFVDVHEMVIYNECIADYKVDASPYSCHLCGLQFHVFRTLTTHLNEHYANCICDVCGKSFINSKRLKVHKRTHESGQFPCAECGKILKTKTSKANHMESAHSNRIIKCQICFKPMKHYNDRIKHMSEVHNITHKFKCPICAREYNIKHYLATHIRQTHGHKNKKCQECEMAFITNHGLKKHMLKHTGVKPFTCSVCCKSYARSYTLREHMRGHDNDRRCLGPE